MESLSSVHSLQASWYGICRNLAVPDYGRSFRGNGRGRRLLEGRRATAGAGFKKDIFYYTCMSNLGDQMENSTCLQVGQVAKFTNLFFSSSSGGLDLFDTYVGGLFSWGPGPI